MLGLSCYYHDSAAALIKDGEVVAAAQEERFSRKKHDSRFPRHAIQYCLRSQSISLENVSSVIYYEKPLLTFERLLETHLGASPRGGRAFIAAMHAWMKSKLFIKSELRNQLRKVQEELAPGRSYVTPLLLFSEHHLSHAAAAFYPSPFKNAVVLCMDGVGEWATTSAWTGEGKNIKSLWEISFPHSLGLLYSSFTYYCGFRVNSGEYKLMGLAPYGEPIYTDKIRDNLIDIKDDGTFRLDLSYFKYHRGFRMTGRKFHKLFGRPPRISETGLTQFHMDLAASIQTITEEIILRLARSLREETGIKNLCLAGGVALNSVVNGKLLQEKIFDDIWIQPASGDAGSALGAALIGWHQYRQKPRVNNLDDSMKGTYLGPSFTNDEITRYLKRINAPFHTLGDLELFQKLAELLDNEKIIGWFSGPMEFGPRALGGRSIIADARSQDMQRMLNLKIKYRESFRPFAPSVLEEDVANQFEMNTKSPYMLFVVPVKNYLCKEISDDQQSLFGINKLNISRSSLPAITHVDYSARVHTVCSKTNPRYYNLIRAFKQRTGCPTIVNTSFNVRGEPIVCTPQDAYRCFMRTEIDVLVLQNQILFKDEQSKVEREEIWTQEFILD